MNAQTFSLNRTTSCLASLNGKIDLKGRFLDELEEIILSWGESRYRARQLMLWLYHKRARSFDQMTDISKAFRNRLNELAYISHPVILAKETSKFDETTKYLFELEDGEKVESVLMYDSDRVTCCVSTQIGCRQGCAFCATGRSGYIRDLTAAEIINQIMAIESDLGSSLFTPNRTMSCLGSLSEKPKVVKSITNVVFMGMGEPFLNYDNSIKAARLMNASEGLMIAARKITVSTSGLVPQIRKFTSEMTQMGLAISLNSADDKVRSQLMPINRHYPIEELLIVCKEWTKAINRWLTVEYILIKDVNDSPDNAKKLCKILHGIPSKINLIVYNPVEGLPYQRPDVSRVESFRKILADAYFVARVRESKGIDIAAACGQLRIRKA